MSENRTGADLVVSALLENGIDCVFGIPGTQTVPLFEAMRRSRIRCVVASSEAAAAFMACGWARLSGSVGVVVTIPGPGFIWSLPGIAEARLDSLPLLLLTGSPSSHPADRRFRQQELDQDAIAAPLTKATFRLEDPNVAPTTVAEAVAAALDGEPGPVLLQLSPAAMRSEATAPHNKRVVTSASSLSDPHDALAELHGLLSRSHRPILLAGQGTIAESDALVELAVSLNAPVLTTPSARGVIPEDHELAIGFDSVAGSIDAVNQLIDQCDLVIAIGAKLGHNGTAGFRLHLPPERLVRIDASAEVLACNYAAKLSICASADVVLRYLSKAQRAQSTWSTKEIGRWRGLVGSHPQKSVEPVVGANADGTARQFFEQLQEALPSDAIIVLDSGNHQILARRYLTVRSPNGLIMPSDLQSMGFALPAAIGASIAAPGRRVVAIVGDGGFAMTGFDLLTCVREQIDLTVVVFADGKLGQIRLHQLADYGAEYSVDLGDMNLELLARGMGARYARSISIAHTVAEVARGGGVTLVEVAVTDGPQILATAGMARLKQGIRSIIGDRLSSRIKALLLRK